LPPPHRETAPPWNSRGHRASSRHSWRPPVNTNSLGRRALETMPENLASSCGTFQSRHRDTSDSEWSVYPPQETRPSSLLPPRCHICFALSSRRYRALLRLAIHQNTRPARSFVRPTLPFFTSAIRRTRSPSCISSSPSATSHHTAKSYHFVSATPPRWLRPRPKSRDTDAATVGPLVPPGGGTIPGRQSLDRIGGGAGLLARPSANGIAAWAGL